MNWIQLLLRHEELGNKMTEKTLGRICFNFWHLLDCKTAGAVNLKLGSLVFEPNQNRRKLIQYL